VEVRQWNELPVPVFVHLHGGKTPPESDGCPTDLILSKGHGHGSPAHAGHGSAGEHSHIFKDYRYLNEQRAATLWYHDHRMDFTGPRSTGVWRACTSCATRSRIRCLCRVARKRCRSGGE
jgi:spore coat protein A, manganese oxidase